MSTPETRVISFPEQGVGLLDAYIRGLPSPSTREAYRRAIRDFESFIDSEMLSVTRRQIESYRSHLESLGRKPPTIGQHLSALNGFYEFAVAEGVVPLNPVASARRPKMSDHSPRRALSPEEIRSLLSVPDCGTLGGLRDKALLTVLIVQGWRIRETLGLKMEDLDEEQGQHVATITGKGGKVARVPLAMAASSTIKEWVQAAGIETGPIFVSVVKGGKGLGAKAQSGQAAWQRIRTLARQGGIRRDVHPHLFRHTAVTQALAAGVALHEVQDFARHADPRTTRRYDSHRLSLENRTAHVLGALLADTPKRSRSESTE